MAATLVLTGAMLASTAGPAQASGNTVQSCRARVVYSEELPFAPVGSWLVNATLEITPHNGSIYYATLQDWMPWQGPPPRRGQTFRLWCDPSHPGNLHLVPGRVVKAAF